MSAANTKSSHSPEAQPRWRRLILEKRPMAELNDTDPTKAESVAEAAARWRSALESETANEADWLDFEHWLAADPKHQMVYAAMETATIDAELALERRRPSPAAAGFAEDQANIVHFAQRLLTRPAVWAAAAAAIAASALIFVVRAPPPPVEYAFAAPAAADERVTLPDGSNIHLNRNAAIHVTYGETRHIVLERGEASFTVAHDATRPFEVAAGDVLVRDIGTVFNIARNRASTVVTVREGAVEIALGGEAVSVGAGYQARLEPGASVAVSATSGDAFAWQHGRLVYNDAPLSAVIEDLNRYSAVPIVLADNARDQRFSGILMLDTPQDMLARLEGFLPIRRVESGERIVVESRP